MGFIRTYINTSKETYYCEILSAFRNLYNEIGYKKITLELIAEKINLQLTDLYKFYTDKNEIMLELIITDIIIWQKDILHDLGDQQHSIEEFADIWTESYIKHKSLLDKLTILFISIEKKVALDKLIIFKTRLKKELITLGEAISTSLPALSSSQIYEFIIMQVATAPGFHTITNLTENQRKALSAAGLADLSNSFHQRLKKIIQRYLEGFIKEKETTN